MSDFTYGRLGKKWSKAGLKTFPDSIFFFSCSNNKIDSCNGSRQSFEFCLKRASPIPPFAFHNPWANHFFNLMNGFWSSTRDRRTAHRKGQGSWPGRKSNLFGSMKYLYLQRLLRQFWMLLMLAGLCSISDSISLLPNNSNRPFPNCSP